MRKNPKTIKLAKIRRYIRQAIDWHKVDDGMPDFWTNENYKTARKVFMKKPASSYPYYIKSDKAIEIIAKKIYEVINAKR